MAKAIRKSERLHEDVPVALGELIHTQVHGSLSATDGSNFIRIDDRRSAVLVKKLGYVFYYLFISHLPHSCFRYCSTHKSVVPFPVLKIMKAGEKTYFNHIFIGGIEKVVREIVPKMKMSLSRSRHRKLCKSLPMSQLYPACTTMTAQIFP
jgi:hypothetical protein